MWAPLKNTSAAETSGNNPGSGADVTTEVLEKLKLSSPKPKNVGSVPVMTTDWMSAALLWKPKKSGPEPAGTLASVARLLYEVSTFFSFRLMIGNTSHYIGGNVGSSCNIRLFPHSVGFLFGINIVAVVALFCVMRVSRAASAEIPAAARLVDVEYR
jgi:hypothetical protein